MSSFVLSQLVLSCKNVLPRLLTTPIKRREAHFFLVSSSVYLMLLFCIYSKGFLRTPDDRDSLCYLIVSTLVFSIQIFDAISYDLL